MKCPRCGMDYDSEKGICPNCGTQVTNNINNNVVIENVSPQAQQSVVAVPNVQPQPNAQIEPNVQNEQNVVVEQNATMNQQVINETPVTDNTLNQQDTSGVNTFAQENVQAEPIVNEASIQGELQNPPVTNEQTAEPQKKDLSKVYYIILAVAIVIFIVLMGLIITNNLKKNKPVAPTPIPKTTESTVETILTKNKGVYTNIVSPTNIGNITYGGIKDNANDKVVDADVEIIRHLTEPEITNFLATQDYALNPGFKYDGVEYRVTLNDFDYLNGASISPVMKTYLFDTYYKNNFFLVNDNYYTINPISGGGPEIRNGESANLIVVYQVPVDQNYYICFGENFSSLGCFINS